MKHYFLILSSFLLFLGAFQFPVANAQCPVQADVLIKTHTDISCFGADDGTITVDIANAATSDPFNFELFDLDAGTIVTFSVTEVEDKPNRSVVYSAIPPGRYSVLFFKAGCPTLNIIDDLTLGFVIDEPPVLTLTGSDVILNCGGLPNGSGSFTAGGGTPGYSFVVNSNTTGGTTSATATTLDFINAGVGSIMVTVTDANGCNLAHTINVTQPPALTLGTTPDVLLACNGDLTATGTFTAGGGTPGYSFTVDSNTTGGTTSTTATTLDFINAGAGSIMVTVTDGNGCTAQSTINVTQPPLLTLATTGVILLSCNGDTNGSGTFTAGGGTGPYGFTVDSNTTGGTVNPAGATTIDFVSAGVGAITVTVTDFNGCTAQSTINITEPPILTLTGVDVLTSCNGATDASGTFTAGGGTPGYSFVVNSNTTGGTTSATATTLDFINAGVGSIMVTVTDANGCNVAYTINVTQPPVLTLGTTPDVLLVCNGDLTATGTFTAGGGTAGYSFTVDSNTAGGTTSTTATTLNFINAGVGSITVTVTDANGCAAQSTINVTQPPALTLGTSGDILLSCNGDTNGAGTFNAAGGTGPYNFTVDTNTTGGTETPGINTFNLTNAGVGLITITVTDANLCTAQATINVTEPALLTLGTTGDVLLTCNGDTNGVATFTASGGTPAFGFTVDSNTTGGTSTTTATTLDLINAGAGAITVTVTDVGGCTAQSTITFTEPTSVIITGTTKTDATCLGLNDGVIQINSSGGTGIQQFSIDNGAIFQVSNTFSGLAPGSYNAVARDANNCLSLAVPITINNGAPINITASSKTDATCFGINDGSIVITTVTGGTGTYTYSSDNGATFQASNTFVGLAAGSYDVIARDGNNCLSPALNIVVAAITTVTFTATPTNATCLGINDGTIIISGETGGSAPYDYSIDNGVIFTGSSTFSSLAPGSYDVVIRDVGLCLSAPTTIAVGNGTTISVNAVNVTDETCAALNNGTIDVASVSGGATPYTYSIDNGATFQASSVFSALAPATFNLVVKDNNGCLSAMQSQTIITGAVVTALVTKTDATCAANDGSIIITNEVGGVGPYQYSIDNGVTFQASGTFSGLAPATYNVVAQESGGCSSAAVIVSVLLPGGCAGPSNCATVIINPIASPAVCSPTDGSIFFDVVPTVPALNNTGVTISITNTTTAFNLTKLNAFTFSDLPVGTYDYTIEYGDPSCIKIGQVTVLLGPDVVDFTVAPNSVNCFGTSGAVVLSNINGSSLTDYSYEVTQSGAVVSTGAITQLESLGAVTVSGFGSGNFEIKLSQDQSATTSCTSPVQSALKPFSVTSPAANLDTLYVTKKISVPDLPTGSMIVGIEESLQEPYEVRLELTAPLIPGQVFAQDFTVANRNPLNLKVEFQAPNLFAGGYLLSIRDALGCRRDYAVNIDVDNNLMIPNIFTPNGDGVNEVFFIRNKPDATEVIVSNRWGKEVYSSKNYQNDWDGGDIADGVYYYRISASGQSYSGWVEVLRGK